MSALAVAPMRVSCAFLFETLGQQASAYLAADERAVILAAGCPPVMLPERGPGVMLFDLPVTEPVLSLPKVVVLLPEPKAQRWAALTPAEVDRVIAHYRRHAQAVRETGAGLQ